ncbi:putative leucine-rich repeat-containing, plant-type, leucine-rich repeat domain superfamily [Helianthus annuus]|nr:putative leucine-rich repeat-containing, plant-type, leucine-rich repeat domain superfamily [Helianthus annuus]
MSFVSFLIILIILFPTLADADCNLDEKESLLSFTTNFPNLNWSSTEDCCSWAGISCDDKRYRVIRLSIPDRGLRGLIPSSLQNLTSLSFLNLSCNFLSGPIPDGLFSSFNNLHTIDLSYNRLSGQLPHTWPPTVQVLNLSSNHFDGTIQTTNLQSFQSMITLNISNNSFTGTIPPSICSNSPALVNLDFSLNHFTGKIPQGFGACSNLVVLSLGSNRLTGQIPTDISCALSLQHLLLQRNYLIGKIDEITNLTNLRSLVLSCNMLSGSIPRNIGKLSFVLQLLILRLNSLGGRLSDFDFSGFSQLSKVDLAVNQFSGVLPKSLFSCKSLTAIRLARNKLVGEILPDILELPSLSFLSLSDNTFKNLSQAFSCASGISGFQELKVMHLGGCRLFGQIPIWLMSLTNLEYISLNGNNINGKIPGWLQYLPNHFFLDLGNNLLSGGLPVELTRLPALASQQVLDQVNNGNFELPVFFVPLNASNWQYNCPASFPPTLDLSENNLSGDIPVEIGNMKSIQVLNLSRNYFSGTIPSSISNLTNLETLELCYNLLSGEIPTSLTSLNFLSSFNVAYNNLQGSVPTGRQFDTFSNQSYEGNPRLCGPPMQKSCSNRSDPSSPPSGHKKVLKTEMIFGPLLGFCFGFGIILTCQLHCMLSERTILPRWIHRYFIWS